jgi:host factor-I protein
MTKTENLQDLFLARVRNGKSAVTVFLINGFQLRGVITAYDNFMICLDTDGKQQIIYKHAVSTIVPAQPVSLSAG